MRLLLRLAVVGLLALAPPAAGAEEFTSYAIARADGSLHIAGRVVRLFGIYIPSTGVTCRTVFSPAECGTRAELALEFKTANQFVTCRTLGALQDGTVSAQCWADDGEDLAAYLIGRGWALARPEAPFEYAALERIAERRGIGLWAPRLERRRLHRWPEW